MVKHSKRYAAVAEKVEEDRLYEPEAAIDLTKDLTTAKFDETVELQDRKSTRLNSSHKPISYAVFCLKKKNLQTLHPLPTNSFTA